MHCAINDEKAHLLINEIDDFSFYQFSSPIDIICYNSLYYIFMLTCLLFLFCVACDYNVHKHPCSETLPDMCTGRKVRQKTIVSSEFSFFYLSADSFVARNVCESKTNKLPSLKIRIGSSSAHPKS